MKRKLFFLVGLVLFGCTLIIGKILLVDIPRTPGELQVLSVPQSTVFVDAKPIGDTPQAISLSPGMHHVKLVAHDTGRTSSRSAALVPWETNIQIQSKSLVFIDQLLGPDILHTAGTVLATQQLRTQPKTGELYIETQPAGALITHNGIDVGIAPIVIPQAAPGVHAISAYLDKMQRRSIQVNVEKNHRTTVQLRLALDPQKNTRNSLSIGDTTLPELPTAAPTTTIAKLTITILDTPTGFLRVRKEASVESAEIGRVQPGESFSYQSEANGWFKIALVDGTEGWVSGQFVQKND